MVVKLEKIDSNKVELEVEVPEEEVERALSKAYTKVVKKINLPGFRKGKIPRSILEARFGREILYEDALEILIPPSYSKAVEEAEIEPIDKPEMELVQMEKGSPLIYKAKVEVKPPVNLAPYKGLEVEQVKEEVTDKQIERYLEALRREHVRLIPQERQARRGDIVLIDFTGVIDGKPFEGGRGEGYSLELGSGSFIPGFEEQLEGVGPGEEKTLKVSFPKDYRNKELAGKEAVFEVKVTEVKEKELPELNDEFIQEISEEETLEAYTASLRQKMAEDLARRQKIDLENRLIEKVSEGSQVELPTVLVERQLDQMLSEMESYLRYQGLTMEQFLTVSGRELSQLREERREEAARRVKGNLVLEAIIKKEGITIEEAEIDDQIKELASTYNDRPERLKELFGKQGRLELMKQELLYRKAIDLLVDNAVIKEVEKPVEAVPAEGTEEQRSGPAADE